MSEYNSKPKGYYASGEDEAVGSGFSFQELLLVIVKKWYWFVISLGICLSLAVLSILTTSPVYSRKTSILVKDKDNATLSSEFSQFSSIGLGKKNTNIRNEMITFRSPLYVRDVVDSLNLEMSYSTKGTFHDNVLYGHNLPIKVSLTDATPDLKAFLTVELTKNNEIVLSGFWSDNIVIPAGTTAEKAEKLKSQVKNKRIKSKLGLITSTPIGQVLVTPSEYYAGETGMKIDVNRTSKDEVVKSIVSRLRVDFIDERASVIEITFTDGSKERAEDVLNVLFDKYNARWVNDINEQAKRTIDFINGELAEIQGELGDVDANISQYKSEHKVPDLTVASNIYMNKAEVTSSELLNYRNQLYMAKYIKSQLVGDTNKFKLLPANSGIDNNVVSQQIMAYNEKLLQRNNLVANSSVNNPYVIDLDQQLSAMRQAILAALDNVIVNLQDHINALQGSASTTEGKIAANPTLEKNLLSVERKQKVMEQQYMFLLQKKAENQLSKAFTNYNTKMLAPPDGNANPIKPVKLNILAIASLLGLAIPIVLIFLMHTLNTTVRGRKDLDVLSVPFIGEIPLSYRPLPGLLKLFQKKKEKTREIVVEAESSNVINEAFRVVRTNLEFISGREGKNKVIMFTSSNPGSGKTFITCNLGASFAIKGKRVIAIDLDLRKASTSTIINSPRKGVADYLSERVDDLDSLIVKGTITPNLDVLPVGTIPPNPTELLFTERFDELIEKLRSLYDFVFIDCPPVEIVADATIINKLCDMTVYVIRSGIMERSMLSEVEKYYTENRYKNMSVILNGTTKDNSGYGRYGYTYGYGYGGKRKKSKSNDEE